MKYLSFKNMNIYRLHRSEEFDHKLGRPVIYLNYIGDESLIWIGSTQVKKNINEEPVILNLNGKKTYFYNNGLQKVKTNSLMHKWRDLKTGKVFNISKDIQEKLVSKFCSFTDLSNPYDQIKNLSSEISNLTERVNELEKTNQELNQDIKKLIIINKQFINKINDLTNQLQKTKEEKQEFSR